MTAKEQILQFLTEHSYRAGGYTPTEIGMKLGKKYTSASSWCATPLKTLVQQGRVKRHAPSPGVVKYFANLVPAEEGVSQLGILKPGEPGYGGYDPNNPQLDYERWPPARGMENKPFDTTGKWFNVECQECGWKGSSEFLDGGGQIADTGDYGDTYCPNCGQVDPDECVQEGGQDED